MIINRPAPASNASRSLLFAALVILWLATVAAPSVSAQTMKARTPMPTARQELGVVEFSGFLYAVGGRNASGWYLGTVEAYDLVSNAWATRAAMPTPRTRFGLAVVNGIIYAVGGETWGGAATAAVEAYEPATNTWTAKAPMNCCTDIPISFEPTFAA